MTERSFMYRVARSLIEQARAAGGDPPAGALGARYLSVARRRRVLRNGRAQGVRELLRGDPLHRAGFRPPLSVAGEPSIVVVRAEGLLLAGCPVALERDEKGEHRGTSFEDAATALSRLRGVPRVSDGEVLEAYRLYMGRARLEPAEDDPERKRPRVRRYLRVPGLIRRNAAELTEVEGRMTEWLQAHTRRVFMAAVQVESLDEALTLAEERHGRDAGVIVGYPGGVQGPLRLNGQEVVTLWGVGRGTACVSAAHLRQLLAIAPPEDGAVVIDCDLDGGWDGWAAPAVELARTMMVDLKIPDDNLRFAYHHERRAGR